MAYKVLVILGSTRPGRLCPEIARWVVGIVPVELDCEIVDLRDWNLPMDDEPGIPARDAYEQPHTEAWSAKIAAADGFVLVSPQYNWGYPAPLKNALDHLYREWTGKPAVMVTYGFHGGDKCAAALRLVLQGLKMRLAVTTPALVLPQELRRPGGRLGDPVEVFAVQAPAVARAMAELAALLAVPGQP